MKVHGPPDSARNGESGLPSSNRGFAPACAGHAALFGMRPGPGVLKWQSRPTRGQILSRIKDEEIDWVDLRFTDPKGKWQHLTMASVVVDEDNLTDGFMFDGSSIAGWKAINESDMILKRTCDAAYIDPFSATPMLVLFCNMSRPSTASCTAATRVRPRPAPRPIEGERRRRHRLCRPGSRILHVRRRPLRGYLQREMLRIDDIELPTNTARELRAAIWRTGRAPRRIFPVASVDSAMDIRGGDGRDDDRDGPTEDKHHHEVSRLPARTGSHYGGLVETADRMQIYKYVVPMVANAYGKTRPHAQADRQGKRQRNAHPHVGLEGRQALVRRNVCGDLR